MLCVFYPQFFLKSPHNHLCSSVVPPRHLCSLANLRLCSLQSWLWDWNGVLAWGRRSRPNRGVALHRCTESGSWMLFNIAGGAAPRSSANINKPCKNEQGWKNKNSFKLLSPPWGDWATQHRLLLKIQGHRGETPQASQSCSDKLEWTSTGHVSPVIPGEQTDPNIPTSRCSYHYRKT